MCIILCKKNINWKGAERRNGKKKVCSRNTTTAKERKKKYCQRHIVLGKLKTIVPLAENHIIVYTTALQMN